MLDQSTVARRPRLVLTVLAVGCAGYAMLQSLVVPALPTLQTTWTRRRPA